MAESYKSSLRRKSVARFGFFLACAYVLLLIPDRPTPQIEGAGKKPFEWSRDQFWASLQNDFVQARGAERSSVSNQVTQSLAESRRLLADLADETTPDARWSELETNVFKLAPLVGADPLRLPEFAALVNGIRRQIKEQSFHWNIDAGPARERLYRFLLGCRMALDEVVIQNPEAAAKLSVECATEPSQTASVIFRDVTLHSGDILVSRGGAPTSALISRGNDYVGTFSHVSLLHVDPITGAGVVIQALIEKGVVITPLKEYSDEPKLRLMVLRPRADLAAMRADPHTPHKAAASALKEATARHTPYDFAMDYRDHSKLFCSEVVSAAYERYGVQLWRGMSYISSPTVAAWLGSLGVRQFETQEPADLEFDPQLRVVAEWRQGSDLWEAHLDDAVTDAMLANAKPGQPLPFSAVKLPLARVAKAYSVVVNWFGLPGLIPEGMSATTALRVSKYLSDHQSKKERLRALAAEFQETHQYAPPYWELVRLATQMQAN